MSGTNGLSFAAGEQAKNVIPDDAVLLGYVAPDDEYTHGGSNPLSFSVGLQDEATEDTDEGEMEATDASPTPESDGDATDDVMAAAGKLLGMTPEEIGQTPPKILERFIEKARLANEKEAEAPDDDDSEEDAKAPDEPEASDDGKDWTPEYDRDMVDPDTAQAIDQITARFNAEIKSLKAQLSDSKITAAEASFDAEMTRLGPEYRDLFGEGPSISLDPTSKYAKNRESLREEMDRISLGYKAMGQKIPSRNDVFTKAVRSQFGDAFESITRRKLNDSISSRQGKFLARPSISNDESMDREAKAIANLGERMKARGLL